MNEQTFSHNKVIVELLENLRLCPRAGVLPDQRILPELLCRQIETLLRLSLDQSDFLFPEMAVGQGIH